MSPTTAVTDSIVSEEIFISDNLSFYICYSGYILFTSSGTHNNLGSNECCTKVQFSLLMSSWNWIHYLYCILTYMSNLINVEKQARTELRASLNFSGFD